MYIINGKLIELMFQMRSYIVPVGAMVSSLVLRSTDWGSNPVWDGQGSKLFGEIALRIRQLFLSVIYSFHVFYIRNLPTENLK